ncbi:MAG: H-NS histone family protein [Xanthomonadales bacterium]|nr:H-NS histone family protein [Xanthomonadales bacterium]
MSIQIENLSQSQLDELIDKARARKDALHREQISSVRDELSAIARQKGYTIEELFGKGRRAASKRGSVPPKFRNPADSSLTWTGRGKRPRWFQAELDAGKSPDSMLIDK